MKKRPISIKQIETIVAEIEKQISNSLIQEIKSEQIGELIMDKLKNLMILPTSDLLVFIENLKI